MCYAAPSVAAIPSGGATALAGYRGLGCEVVKVQSLKIRISRTYITIIPRFAVVSIVIANIVRVTRKFLLCLAVSWCSIHGEVIFMLKDNLRKARLTAGLSKAEVARRLKMGYTTYDGYETGRRTPKPDSLPEIANVLGVDVNVLLYGKVAADGIKMSNDAEYIPNEDLVTRMKENEVIGGMRIILSDAFDKLNTLGKVLLYKDAKKYLGIPELVMDAEESAKAEIARRACEKSILAEQTISTMKGMPRVASVLPTLYGLGYSDDEVKEFIKYLSKEDPDSFNVDSEVLPKTSTDE